MTIPKLQPPAKPKDPDPNPLKIIGDELNHEYQVPDEVVKIAEKRAMEERHQYLVYPEDQVNQAQARADAAFDQFKSDLPNVIDQK